MHILNVGTGYGRLVFRMHLIRGICSMWFAKKSCMSLTRMGQRSGCWHENLREINRLVNIVGHGPGSGNLYVIKGLGYDMI